MQSAHAIPLSTVFDGWGGYQTSLAHAIEPLSAEQLGWKPSEKLRSVGEIARHIALGRINWFMRMDAPGSAELAAKIEAWDTDTHGNRYIREADIKIDRDAGALVDWLNASWNMIERTLQAWTVEDLQVTYQHVFRGDIYDVSRQWTVWRVMAHDIHHGGQIARILAERGIEAPELRGLGGHIVSPRKVGRA
ncbi:MAG TPA: DinB family protein [Bryobacteraceae bacterium]|nr:DinB family protein [Bryobacteraceae bacterium]